jgi:hypothetical protein
MTESNTIIPKIDKLIDHWCERRALKPLGFILRSYPFRSGLTDECGALLECLKDIKGLCGSELTSDEKKILVEVINAVDDAVYHRNQ